MIFKDKILDFYNLKGKNINGDVYLLKKNRYLTFLNTTITHANIESFLEPLENSVQTNKWKTIIVVAEADEFFSKKDLFYFNSVDTFIVFILLNKNNMEIYYFANWIYVLGLNFKKYVKQIVEIMKS